MLPIESSFARDRIRRRKQHRSVVKPYTQESLQQPGFDTPVIHYWEVEEDDDPASEFLRKTVDVVPFKKEGTVFSA